MKSGASFEWDSNKDAINVQQHGIAFELAQRAFLDPKRIILQDLDHSDTEDRFFCIGLVDDGIMTVRFTLRNRSKTIRIIGAGYWRKGKKIYEKENNLHG